MQCFHVLLAILLTLISCNNSSSVDESAIKASTQAYAEAFNKKDAQALGALWTDDAAYINSETGVTNEGRDAIANKFDTYFKKHPNAKILIKTESISFPSKDEAEETATTTITDNGEVIAETAYKAFYENQNGHWLIAELREVKAEKPPAPSQHLQELAWLAGAWIDEDEDVTITSSYTWNRYKTFLYQEFSVVAEGKFELDGTQIIGWDPTQNSIRSWVFDSDGGFGKGSWKKEGNRWIIEIATTLADGRRASAINILTPVDADHFTIQTTGRSVGGELLPDIDPVTVVRKKI